LDEGKNQDQALWGEVLAAQCQAYSLLKHSLTVAVAQLSVTPETKLETIVKLRAMYESNDGDQLSFVRRIKTAARQRGPLWHIGTFAATGEWPDSGALYFRDSSKAAWTKLGGEQRAFAVAQRASDSAIDPHPYLAVFALEKADTLRPVPGAGYYNRKNARAYGLFGRFPLAQRDGWHEIKQLHGVHDLCATRGLNKNEVLIYTATGTSIERFVHGGRWYEGDKEKLVVPSNMNLSVPAGYLVDSVCAVAEPEFVTASGVEDVPSRWVVYGGLERAGRRYIWAHFHGGPIGTFLSERGEMTGMKVDQKHLWVFTRQFIACMTHAQARQAFQGCQPPKWMVYNIPSELGGQWQSEGKFDGLLDLAPCDDGTLVAVFSDKRTKHIYQCEPTLDLAKGTLVIAGTKTDEYHRITTTNGWTRTEGAEANRVAKQPIFCWGLIEGLESTLQGADARG